MKKCLNHVCLVLLFIVLSICCTGQSPIYADRYPKNSPQMKAYEYLINQYGLTPEQYRKIMHRIMNDIYYQKMKRQNRDHAYVSGIVKALGECAGDLKKADLTKLEKALLAHDRLVLRSQYDLFSGGYRIENSTEKPKEKSKFAHSAYGPLVDGAGVCQGYAEAYCLLMYYLGMDCDYVSSEQLNHGWNILNLDGVRYFVDCTFDDPVPDRAGRAMHEHFLVSSAAYSEMLKPKNITDFDMGLTDTRYDKAFWKNVTTPFMHIKGNIYYLDDSSASINRYKKGKVTKLLTLEDDVWKRGEDSYFLNKYYNIDMDSDKIYYNDSTHVYEFDPLNNVSKMVYSPPIDHSIYERIYEFSAKNGAFRFTLKHFSHFDDFEGKSRTLSVKNPDPEVYFVDYHKISSPAREAMEFCLEQNLLGEAGYRKLRPEMPINRAQLVTVLWRMAGSPASSQKSPFRDLKADWYKKAVSWAVEKNLVKGTSDHYFEPNRKISEQELLLILYRFENYLTEQNLRFKQTTKENKQVYVLEKDEEKKAGEKQEDKWNQSQKERDELLQYEDASDIDSWAKDAVLWAKKANILYGNVKEAASFAPGSDVTREQMSILLRNYILTDR